MIHLNVWLRFPDGEQVQAGNTASILQKTWPDFIGKWFLMLLLGNTDDHLKNFLLLHDDAGYYLSPAFDRLPDIGEYQAHVLRFNNDESPPTREILLAMASAFNLNKQQALNMVDHVLTAVNEWRLVFCEHGAPEKDISRLARDIDARLRRVATKIGL